MTTVQPTNPGYAHISFFSFTFFFFFWLRDEKANQFTNTVSDTQKSYALKDIQNKPCYWAIRTHYLKKKVRKVKNKTKNKRTKNIHKKRRRRKENKEKHPSTP